MQQLYIQTQYIILISVNIFCLEVFPAQSLQLFHPDPAIPAFLNFTP